MTSTRLPEAARQQLLLRALWRQVPPDELAARLRDNGRLQRGLQAYQAHAGAQAQRALAAAYPTVMALISEDSFAGLARAFWQLYPPTGGDLAIWGAALADFMQTLPELSAEAYLGDVARLEWAVHQAHTAADPSLSPLGLERLAEPGAEALVLQLRPGTALVLSQHPICSIWQAHQVHPVHPVHQALGQQGETCDVFEPMRQAFDAGRGENAWVWRQRFEVQVHRLSPQDTRFAAAVIAGQSLGQALDLADPGFSFEAWLHAGLRSGWLSGLADPGSQA